MAGHKNEMRSWDNNYHGWWDDAVKGNSALRSGLLRRIYEEVATRNGQPAVCMFFDMEKFYDSVCLRKLIDQALERNFQKRLLEHMWIKLFPHNFLRQSKHASLWMISRPCR